MKKIAFIGAGNHASQNLYPSALLCGAKIVAVATRNLETANRAIIKFGLTEALAYDDHKKMLAECDCDGVIISTGMDNQFNIVLDVISAKKNFLVEKPLGLSEAQAKEAAELADKNGVFGAVAFMKRFAPVHTMLKDAIDGGDIGAPLSFNAMMSVDCSMFVNSDEMMLKAAMIHYLDLARHIFGDAVEARGFCNNKGSATNLVFSLLFESGVCGNLYFSSNKAWSRHDEFFIVTGESGFAKVYDFTKFCLHKHTENAGNWKNQSECDFVYSPAASTMSGGHRDLYMNGFVGEIADFLDCLESGRKPVNSLWDNVKTMKLCDDVLTACHISADGK